MGQKMKAAWVAMLTILALAAVTTADGEDRLGHRTPQAMVGRALVTPDQQLMRGLKTAQNKTSGGRRLSAIINSLCRDNAPA